MVFGDIHVVKLNQGGASSVCCRADRLQRGSKPACQREVMGYVTRPDVMNTEREIKDNTVRIYVSSFNMQIIKYIEKQKCLKVSEAVC